MVSLTRYLHIYDDALNYELTEEQAKFTSSIFHCIHFEKVLEDITKQIVVVTKDNKPIGFFILDNSNDKLKLSDNPSSLILRSFSLNPEYQNQGIAKKAMTLLPDYVGEKFSEINEIVLSVNFKNVNAYHAYLRSGFIDTGKVIEGVLGFQHVLSKRLTGKYISSNRK